MLFRSAVCVVALAISGCATTKIESRINPGYDGGPRKSIGIVASAKNDIGWMRSIERQICSNLALHGIVCQVGARALSAFEEWDTKEKVHLQLERRGVELAVFVLLKRKYKEQETAYISQYDADGNYSGSQPVTTNKPQQEFTVIVDDVTTGQRVLIATARTSGNEFAGDQVMVESIADSVIEELNRANLLSKSRPYEEDSVVRSFLEQASGKTVYITPVGLTGGETFPMYFPGDGATIVSIPGGEEPACSEGPFSVEGSDRVCFYTPTEGLPGNCWVMQREDDSYLFDADPNVVDASGKFKATKFEQSIPKCR